eukprot:7816024-Ditylum_brightwellii.AAC.1
MAVAAILFLAMAVAVLLRYDGGGCFSAIIGGGGFRLLHDNDSGGFSPAMAVAAILFLVMAVVVLLHYDGGGCFSAIIGG